MRTHPSTTANHNVPKDACVIVEMSQCSGEIITSYYIMPDGSFWQVADWSTSRPHPATMHDFCSLTGLPERQIIGMWQSHLARQGQQTGQTPERMDT